MAGRSQLSEWREGLKEMGDERVLEFLNRVPVIADFQPEPDFSFGDGQGPEVSLDDLVDNPEFDDLFTFRTKSPFLGAENPDGAFDRMFQPALKNALEWQLIDRYLLEQLLKERNVEKGFLLAQIEGLPDTVEIHSELPLTGRGEEKRRLTSEEVRQGLREFLDVARDFKKQISVFVYRRTSAGFPHPRLQRMRFSQGDLITGLDNGIASISRWTESVLFTRAAVDEWDNAVKNLAKLHVEEIQSS